MEIEFLCPLHERSKRDDEKKLASQLAATETKTEIRTEIEVATLLRT